MGTNDPNELLGPWLLDADEGPARRQSELEAGAQLAEVMARARAMGLVAPEPRRSMSRVRRMSVRAVGLWVVGSLMAGSAAALVATQTGLFRTYERVVETPPVQPVVRRPRIKPRQEHPQPELPIVEAPEPAAPQPKPGELLARANHLRGEGKYRAAVRVYMLALRADPRGAAGNVAAVAAAAIRLEFLNNPRGAAALYRRALSIRPQGPLALESYEGLARAYRALGRRDAERKALQALIDLDVPSPAQARAKERLETLSEVSPVGGLGQP